MTTAHRRCRRLRLTRLTRALAGLALVCGLAPAGAGAVPVPVGFGLTIEITGDAGSWIGTETTLADDLSLATSGDEVSLALTGAKTVLGGDATIESWGSIYDPDPFVTNDFVVVNNSGANQTYVVSVVAPVNPAFSVGQIVQSTILLTLADDDNDSGATVSSALGMPVYEAFVNGVSALTFLDDPFSNSCTSPVNCLSSGISADGVTSQPYGPVSATSIGLTITFELSPGDSAAVQSRFEVVPEPGTALLVGLGLALTAVWGRRPAA